MLKSKSSQQQRLMTSAQNDLQPPAAGLEIVVTRSLRKAPAGEGPLLAWPVACGSAVSARTRALDFVGGILRVEVPDAGWRRELQSLAPRYLATLNRYLVESVMRIEFIVSVKK
jgi:Dna[CI] antecedent, DciA